MNTVTIKCRSQFRSSAKTELSFDSACEVYEVTLAQVCEKCV